MSETKYVLGGATTQKDGDFILASIFVVLIVVEGAFGKWVSPVLEYPPVLLRDLVAVFLIYRAWSSGRLQQHATLYSLLLIWTALVTVFSFLQALFLGYGLIVITIGLRFWVLYLWVALALCSTINWRDYNRLCQLLVKLLWLMLPLLLAQTFAGADAWINKTSSNDGYVFTIANNIARASGTFSFTLGFTCFLAAVTPLLLSPVSLQPSSALGQSKAKILGMGLLVLCAVISGSRGAIVFTASMAAMTILVTLAWGIPAAKSVILGLAVGLTVLIVLPLLIPETISAIETRVVAASDAEDSVRRILDVLVGSSGAWSEFSLIGEGLGLAANMSSRLAGVTASGQFVLAEIEIERVILAGGLIGLLWQLIKIGIVMAGFLAASRATSQTQWSRPMLTWIAAAVALLTWPLSGQLTAQALGMLLLAMAALSVGIFDTSRP